MRVEIGGHALNCERVGAGSRVALLIHGLGASLRSWPTEVVDALAPDYEVLLLDLRGHGLSDSPPGAWTVDDLVADVRALLDVLAIPAVCAVGHSAGGVVALALALAHPQLVDGLALVSTSSECNVAAAEWYSSVAEVALEQGIGPALRQVVAGLRLEASPAQDELVLPDPLGFAQTARCVASLHPRPLTPRLAEIRCPTRVLVGELDPIGVGGAILLQRGIAGSTLEVVPGCSHMLPQDDPAGFAARVREHLASLGAT